MIIITVISIFQYIYYYCLLLHNDFTLFIRPAFHYDKYDWMGV